ncbi:unnamed protein product [Paramecium octaurelia]|uniref:Uncharacterized protein n=1 Tax=Paramecium octaurelia TaxID=43137 RepID=A0A8S1W5Z1_PAROT|nr:unnamed protein product [Paramecium octaurelia]
MYSTDPRLQQQFGQQTNQFQVSPRQNQFVQSPRQFQQSPNYNNGQMISPQQRQLMGSPQSQQMKQLQLQQSPIIPTRQTQQNPINMSNPKTIRPTNQSQKVGQSSQSSQPQVQAQEFRHIERPLQVVKADDIEAPWKSKCAALERQILELQIQIKKNNGTIIEENVQEVQDDTKVKNLLNLKQELEKKISDDEEFMKELRLKLQELQEEYQVIITEKVTYASNEVETWMKKYTNLEKNYKESQQKISDLKRQLAQVEAADKAAQDQKKMDAKSEVRKSSKIF